MHRKALTIVVYSILVVFTLMFVLFYSNTRQFIFMERIDDSFMEIALDFSHAVYVKDWNRSSEQFPPVFREKDVSYHLQNKNWESSNTFNRLAGSGWNLYCNKIGSNIQLPQGAQILTGSKMQTGHKITFVVAFRGSTKLEDYVFTNCKNEPIVLGWTDSFKGWWRGKRIGAILEQFYTPSITAMLSSSLVVGGSNLFPASPTFVHRGYVEQVSYTLSSKIVDPMDGVCLTVLEAFKKYPSADFIITGHSAGGGDAHVLSVLAWEMGLNQQNRIHTRTFAAAGSFNHAGQVQYQGFDSINYFMPGDPILFVNGISGYGPIGVNVMLPTSPIISKYSRAIHQLPAYETQLTRTP